MKTSHHHQHHQHYPERHLLFLLAARTLTAEPVSLAPPPHSPCCCRCCQCRRFCISAVSSPAVCVCVREICTASVLTDVSCLTFGLRLNPLSLTGNPQPTCLHHLSHGGLSSAAPCPSPCRRARSSLSVSHGAALRPPPRPPPRHERDLYLPHTRLRHLHRRLAFISQRRGAEFAGGRYRLEQIDAGAHQ